jgi:hypothetical protein
MWIDDSRLKTIREPHGDREAVDRLLAEILDRVAVDEIPSGCPVCHQRLIVRTELGLAVRTCAAGHGAWLSTADVSALRARAAHAVRSARRRRMVVTLVVVAAAALFLVRERIESMITASFFPPAVHQPKHVFDRAPVAPGGPGHFAAIPVKGSAIDVHEELVYAVDVFKLLEDGIDNRLAIDKTLSRPQADPAAAFATFDGKQRDFLARLRARPTPVRLAPFHQHLVTATEHQIELYRAFAERKAAEPALDLRGMLRHPALVTTNRELLSAYALFKQLYPELDQQTHDALYGRLCAFDII